MGDKSPKNNENRNKKNEMAKKVIMPVLPTKPDAKK